MNITINNTQLFSNDTLNYLAEELYANGYCIFKDAFPEQFIKALTERLSEQRPQLEAAGIGRKNNHHINDVIRTDTIRWINKEDPIEEAYLDVMESLRLSLNRRLFLGLFDYESHFACYPPGGFYKKHQDAFTGQSNRILTTVLYLNNQWDNQSGGELVIYNHKDQHIATVPPEAGTFVIFLSDEFPHEVYKTNKNRYSVAGWFRINSSSEDKIDPPQ